MEKKVIKPFYHTHPLILTENVSDEESLDCYGCGYLVTSLEAAYVCTQQQNCLSRIILHKKCGELPSEIQHHKHPQHPIHLSDYHDYMGYLWCNLCCRDLGMVLGYECSSCNFAIDLACEKISIDAMLEEKRELQHPSHPHHPLTLMRKSSFAFYCDGCGTQDVDMAYICSICEFWVHKTCVSLPLVLSIYHHHHQLTLAFSIPMKHSTYTYYCDVCGKRFDTTCWVYYCDDCRYFSHLKCATTAAETTKQDSNIDEDDGTHVVQFPLHAHDISKELITPFVMREKGLKKIPHPYVKDMPTTVHMPQTTSSFSFLFNYHNHPLSLVSELSIEDKEQEDEDEDEGAYDDKLKICDVCVTPISSPPYYECAAPCKYFVHSICYFLPKTLPSSSPDLYGDCNYSHDKHHKFTLYTSSEWTDKAAELCWCELCGFITNGMVYECEGCKIMIDVKCASLPANMRHASHPLHKPLVMTRIPTQGVGSRKHCHACDGYLYDCTAYCCSSNDCDFALHLKCAMLPASIAKREWDSHPLLLSFDASLDHPSDFICDFCEEELPNPKLWMYHCRQCDLSFHLGCLKNTASGWYKNIKFGRRFVLDGIHPNHPLTFNCVTLKRRCDLCYRGVYNYCGLECASCNYVVCLGCARRELAKI